MNQQDLARVLCGMRGESLAQLPTNGVILAASPIMRQPMSNPYRVVLRAIPKQMGMEFVVHDQIWLDRFVLPDGTLSPYTEGSFDRGDYFYPFEQGADPVAVYVKAFTRWTERVQREIGYAPTIARQIAKAS